MKKKLIITTLLLLTFSIFCNNNDAKQVEISIQWKKTGGFGSNQCAVWVENENGNHIKTLYVSKFTGKGGFKKRPDCLTEWRNKAKITDSIPDEIDAVTQSTPKNGKNLFYWDLTDSNNSTTPQGIYYLKVEANLRFEKRVVWTAKIDTSKNEDSCNAVAEYFSVEEDSVKENTVIDVFVEYK